MSKMKKGSFDSKVEHETDEQQLPTSKALKEFNEEMEQIADKNYTVDMKQLRKNFVENKIDMEYLNQIFRTNGLNLNDQDIVIVSDDEDIDKEVLDRQLFGDIDLRR